MNLSSQNQQLLEEKLALQDKVGLTLTTRFLEKITVYLVLKTYISTVKQVFLEVRKNRWDKIWVASC